MNVVNQPTVNLDATDSGYLDDIQSNTFASSQDLNEVKTGSQKFFTCPYNPGSPGTCANSANGHFPVDVENFPATQNVMGTVSIAGEVTVNLNANNQTIPVTVAGPNPLPVSGTVAVSNLPAQQHVIVDSNNLGYFVDFEYSHPTANPITFSSTPASISFSYVMTSPMSYIVVGAGSLNIRCSSSPCGVATNFTTSYNVISSIYAYCNGTAPPSTLFSAGDNVNYFLIGVTQQVGVTGVGTFITLSFGFAPLAAADHRGSLHQLERPVCFRPIS